MKKQLSTGIASYRKVRKNNYYTVDKSLMIQTFMERGSEVTLITRPRRFGKSLNMSMMAEFFDITKDSKAIFEGTAIMNTQYAKEMNQYPTIFLSFADCKGKYSSMKVKLFEILLKSYEPYESMFDHVACSEGLKRRIKKIYQALQDETQLESISSSIETLSEFLSVVYKKPTMIFIDEYDTPFNEAQESGFYNEIRGFLSALLHSALKDNNYLQYAMITGIQRVAKENIFSDLNNLEVFTVIDKEYATYFGFTTEETKELLEYYDLELNDAVKAMYNGYNMGGIEIYNPWSILNYAKRKELISYWVNTSNNKMIKEALKNSNKSFKTAYEKLIQDGYLVTQVNLNTSFYEVKDNENLWGLFVNAGYLTIDEVIDLEEEIYHIRIPNREVLREFKSLTADYLEVSTIELKSLFDGLKHKDMKQLNEAYKALLLNNPSYHDLRNENSYHMFLLGICLYMKTDYEVLSNREAGKGRSDIVLKAKRQGMPSYVLEFKYTKDETKLEAFASKALKQMETKQYDVELTGEIIHIAFAHCGKDVEMLWKIKQ